MGPTTHCSQSAKSKFAFCEETGKPEPRLISIDPLLSLCHLHFTPSVTSGVPARPGGLLHHAGDGAGDPDPGAAGQEPHPRRRQLQGRTPGRGEDRKERN